MIRTEYGDFTERNPCGHYGKNYDCFGGDAWYQVCNVCGHVLAFAG